MKICIDQNERQFEEQFQLVEECVEKILLDLPQDRIVTEILIDGRQLGQSSGLLKHRIESVDEIQVLTADKNIWAANGIDMALDRLEKMQNSLIRSAELFREKDPSQANAFFARCIEGLQRFMETVLITRAVLKLDFTQVSFEGISLSDTEEQLNKILQAILSKQSDKDYDAIADKIEYELLPNLYNWKEALVQLRK